MEATTVLPVDLKERFGRRYRFEYEPSYCAEYGAGARVDDPWLMVIPCENGQICPWGGSTLAACTKAAGSVANRLKMLPFTTVKQDGSDGANVLFDVEHFDRVAKTMKPRRRRRLSPEARHAAGERLALPHISTKEFTETWIDFLQAWPRVEIPRGVTMALIMQRALGSAHK